MLEVAEVVSVSARKGHGLGKTIAGAIELVAGQGVLGDAHCGVTVKHQSRVAKDPSQPNLRQVHLIHAELLDELAARGFDVKPGELGENILTRRIDLLRLSEGSALHISSGARLQVTGLRNPCVQINGHSLRLMEALLDRAKDGTLIRKGGIMAIVLTSGIVKAGDRVTCVTFDGPHLPLQPV
jgi:MOSC domain-containing protein YiiM